MALTEQRHNVHKFRDIKPRLNNDNWISWKRELLATARDRGLYQIILGKDPKPTSLTSDTFAEKLSAWNERNDTAYNQILLNISTEIQSLLDDTDQAEEAWKILGNKLNQPTRAK